jgi:2-polyprenyl-3-methyl-5-hydroxy-6-metoxy-1,4-benzoquinol methylase
MPFAAKAAVSGRPTQPSGAWLGDKARGFETPTATPESEVQHSDWQHANRSWWEEHPMRYDWKQPLPGVPGELDWYREMDRRLFKATVLPPSALPFESLLPRETLAGKTVLEVGVGMGAHAQILAKGARRFVGIDLSRPAVAATRRRMELTGAGSAAADGCGEARFSRRVL